MKLFVQAAFLSVILLSSVYANAKIFNCQAGRSDLVTFTAQFVADEVKIKFSRKQGEEGRNLAGKSVVLKFDPERGNEEWNYNVGKVLVDHVFAEYIHIELGYKVSAIGIEKLDGNFAISPLSSEGWPRWLNSMELNCN